MDKDSPFFTHCFLTTFLLFASQSAIKTAGSERTRSKLPSKRLPLKRQLLTRLLLLPARGNLGHAVGLTRLRRMLQRSRTPQSQPRLSDDARAVASLKSSQRSREKLHLLNRHLLASLAAGAKLATGTAPRPRTRNAPCPRIRPSMPTRVASITTAIDVAKISRRESRAGVRPHLPSPRTATA